MTNKYINWPEIYNKPGLFHIYFTERGRGKTDTKAWSFLEIITQPGEVCLAWIRRRWRDSLYCSKPLFESLIYKFCEDKKINPNHFEIQEKGVYYKGKRRIHFYDLFSYQRARGAIARITFQEIVYEEAIPIDQEFLPREQHDFRDLVKSLKRMNNNLKITFLANAYSWSAWLLNVFEEQGLLFDLKKEAEEKANNNDNSGASQLTKDEKGVEWFFYVNLIEGEYDPHYAALEEKLNPSTRNWDDFMIARPKKYQILHAIQDYFFCEVGERKKFKKYCLMHFSRNVKGVSDNLVNFCFNLEEKAKSKLINCVLREKPKIVNRWVNMLKTEMLRFTDFRSRDWFLEQLR